MSEKKTIETALIKIRNLFLKRPNVIKITHNELVYIEINIAVYFNLTALFTILVIFDVIFFESFSR
jgi:hypothetical protein